MPYTHEIKNMKELNGLMSNNIFMYERMRECGLEILADTYAVRVCQFEQMILRRQRLALRQLKSHVFGATADFDYWKSELIQ